MKLDWFKNMGCSYEFEESKGGGPEEWRRRDDVRKVTKGGGDRMSLKN